jgi:hypothetical protein
VAQPRAALILQLLHGTERWPIRTPGVI